MEHYALSAEVYGVGLVFGRVGAMVMLLPGVGETFVPPRIRLAFAFILSLILWPVVRATLPPVPSTVDGLATQIIGAVIIGLAMGAILRLFLATLLVTGEVISLQTTLAFSQTANPMQAQPSATVGTFLNLVGLTLVFATNLHQIFIGAMVKSFFLFSAAHPLPVGDLTSLEIRMTGETFALGIQLAAPILVFALVFNVSAGLIGRVMPHFQIYSAATPLTLLFGLSIFAMSLGTLGLVWVDRFRAFAIRLT